jgi:hypothetical protein
MQDGGGVPRATITIWPDRLEMAVPLLSAVFRPRSIARQRVNYLLGTRRISAADVLATFAHYEYPVDWKPKTIRKYMVGAELSLDRLSGK